MRFSDRTGAVRGSTEIEWIGLEEYLVINLARPNRLFHKVEDECRKLLGGSFDADRLVRLAVQHAVFPLVYRNLRSMGDSVVDPIVTKALGSYYHSSHRNGLLLSHTLFELISELSEVGVEVVVHKGLVVATCYYGEIGDRVFGDLDLFVRKDDVRVAADVLGRLQFESIDPIPETLEDNWTTYRPWQNPHGNAVGFVKRIGPQDQVDVDLQWGMAPHYFTLDLDPAPLWERIRSVPVLDRHVRTFSSEDTFFLLCLHGAKHEWTELRQVVDIAAFLSATPDLDWDAVLDSAERSRCRRIVFLAARLGAEVMGAPIPEEIRVETDAPVIRDLFDRVVARRFAERPGTMARFQQAVSFQVRARDRRRDSIGSVFHQLQVAIGLT